MCVCACVIETEESLKDNGGVSVRGLVKGSHHTHTHTYRQTQSPDRDKRKGLCLLDAHTVTWTAHTHSFAVDDGRVDSDTNPLIHLYMYMQLRAPVRSRPTARTQQHHRPRPHWSITHMHKYIKTCVYTHCTPVQSPDSTHTAASLTVVALIAVVRAAPVREAARLAACASAAAKPLVANCA